MSTNQLVLVLLLASATFPWLTISLQETRSVSTTPIVVRGQVGGPGTCILSNCSKPVLECLVEGQCGKAILCNSKCRNQANQEACNLLCELTYGYNSSKYRAVLKCMSDHYCLPISPPDGSCLANDTSTIKNLTDMSQVCFTTICLSLSLSLPLSPTPF